MPTENNGGTKLSFSLGKSKKTTKKANNVDTGKTLVTTETLRKDFGGDEDANAGSSHQNNNSNQHEPLLVIPLPEGTTQSLLDRCVQKKTKNGIQNERDATANGKVEPKKEDVEQNEPNRNDDTRRHRPEIVASIKNENHDQGPPDNTASSRQQLQRELEHLPDATTEESYQSVPVSQFGAALLRGMGWVDDSNKDKSKNDESVMPRPHRLGLGAIPKAPDASSTNNMPSMKKGKRGQKKPTVQQLQQQEEFERKREMQRKQGKQRTLQNGSIVYCGGNKRAQVLQLLGVPGLNMVQVHMEGDKEPCTIKRGQLGELVPRHELDQDPFTGPTCNTNSTTRAPAASHKDDRDRRSRDRDRGRSDRMDESDSDDNDSRRRDHARKRQHKGESDKDSREGPDKKRNKSDRHQESSPSSRRDRDKRRDSSKRRRDRSHSRERQRRRERDRDHQRDRDRDLSSDRERSRDRERKTDDRNGGSRDKERSRDRSRSRDSDRRSKGSRDREDEKGLGSKRNDRDRTSDTKRSDRGDVKQVESDALPMWIIPHIRVRVVTEKLGKKYFREKGIIVDVTRRHGATLKLDMRNNGTDVVLEHVQERYLETALPKPGGNAIVLIGPHKWTKGRLLERNSKSAKGVIQVFEDMSVLTLSLDDIAEWCGPVDD